MAPTDTPGPARLEPAFLAAWPALAVEWHGQWAARFADGYSKRANSVTCLGPDGDEARVERIAAAYAARRLPPVFRITPLAPAWLDGALARRGYAVVDPVRFMTLSAAATAPDPDWQAASAATAEWCAGYAAASGIAPRHLPTMQAILARIVPEAVFGTLRLEGAPAGWALVVRDGPLAAIFDVVVRPDLRGRGLGRRLMAAVLAEAAGRTAWLQVIETNAVACGLYASLGFTEAYQAHYRAASGP